jgi:hypothetical protein
MQQPYQQSSVVVQAKAHFQGRSAESITEICIYVSVQIGTAAVFSEKSEWETLKLLKCFKSILLSI